MARRSVAVPAVGVYFVSPRARAAIAAFLIGCGVSKSGSPAVSTSTSRPWAIRAEARALAAALGESLTRCTRRDSGKAWVVMVPFDAAGLLRAPIEGCAVELALPR